MVPKSEKVNFKYVITTFNPGWKFTPIHREWGGIGDSQIGRFLQVDPIYEIPKQLSHSAFTAFANNPISIVDPTGMVWQDTTQRNTLIQAVNDRKSKILKNTAEILSRDNSNASEKEKESDQAQLEENEQMPDLLDQSLQDIQDIDQAEEVFTLTNEVSASGSATVTFEGGVVQIGGNGVEAQLHEIRHVGQSFAAGGMKWASENGVQTLQNAGYPD